MVRIVSCCALIIAFGVAMADPELPQATTDGLLRVDSKVVDAVYEDPDADFSVYDAILIAEPHVAFRKNWLRDQNRNSIRRISTRDMEDIRSRAKELLEEVFREELAQQSRFAIVDEPGPTVLVIRPGIVDLDVRAPDTMAVGVTSFTQTSAAATLQLDVMDAESGEVLARAVDRRQTRRSVEFQWANRARATAEGRQLFRHWAKLLRQELEAL